MATYENLKDYIQNEHIKLINRAITNHQHNIQIGDSDVKILSLYCTDDEFNNLEMELGVSVNITDSNAIECKNQLFYKVTLVGDLDLRFQDIHVTNVEKSDINEFPEDNILNHFILPDIRKDDLERIGSELYSYYKCYTEYDGIDFPLDKIINSMNAPIFFTDLPDDCLGRVNFSHSDIDIYHYDTSIHDLKYHSCRTEPGTILINKKRYYDERDGEFLITVAHELVHWQLHQKFLKLLVILGTDSDTMNCKRKPTLYDESMSDIHKAFCIAEWQANALAMRLAIPQSTVEIAINMVANDPATHYDNYGDRMQACVINFARRYGVSCYVAKERLRQLGYDFVDGTILEYEDNSKKIQPAPFYFEPGTLKENETFVIYRADYEKLLKENKEFADLINTEKYVYLGYVVCLLDSKYIDIVSSSDGVELVLTDYAREHADECFLKIKYKTAMLSTFPYHYCGSSYMNRIPDYNEIIPESFELCNEYCGLDQNTVNQIKEYNDTLNNLKSSACSTLANTVVYHMKAKNIDDKDLAKRTKLSVPAIEKIYTGKTKNVNFKNVMALCIGLELDSEECYDMFEKAKYNIREDTMRNRAYRFLFSCTHLGLKECNKILRHFNQEELPDHKKNSAKKRT